MRLIQGKLVCKFKHSLNCTYYYNNKAWGYILTNAYLDIGNHQRKKSTRLKFLSITNIEVVV